MAGLLTIDEEIAAAGKSIADLHFEQMSGDIEIIGRAGPSTVRNWITVRDFHAAHCNEAPPDWFSPIFRERPESPESYRSLVADGLKEAWCDWCDDNGAADLTPDLVNRFATVQAEYRAYSAADDQWKEERSLARDTQWRYRWADAMLTARGISFGR